MLKRLFAPLALIATVVAGCTDPLQGNGGAVVLVFPIYSPATGAIPVPNDLLLDGTLDVTFNAPVVDPLDISDPFVQLNRMAGWSPGAPFKIEFSGAIDIATLVPGTTIRIFEVTLTGPGGGVTGIVGEVPPADYGVVLAAEDATGATARVTWNTPLAAATSYLVVLTNGIADPAANALTMDSSYFIAQTTTPLPPAHPLAGLQMLVNSFEAAAAGAGTPADTVVVSYVFTTQAVGAALSATRDIANGLEASVITNVCAILPFGCADTTPNPLSLPSIVVDTPSIGTTFDLIGAGPGAADVFTGGLTLPYYLLAASNPTAATPVVDPTPLDGFWTSRYEYFPGDTEMNVSRFNFLPLVKSQEIVPALISIPNSVGAPPAGGWPIVIFQHGITSDRTAMLGIADALGLAGIACVAIDMPLHGLSPADPLFDGYMDGTRRERTFGLDLVDNATGAPGPDGLADASGTHMINLVNLLTSRDQLRQATTDLFALTAVLPSVDFLTNATGAVGTDGNPDFDPARTHFIGHSLGAMVGTPFAALETTVVGSTLAMPGGGIAKLLEASATFGPQIQAGLAAAGVIPGTSDYEDFLWLAQTVLDSADPIHWAGALAAAGTPVHVMEVVGGGAGGGVADLVIPNSVAGAPLSGTDPLATELGSIQISTTTVDGGGLHAVVRYVEGTHSSILLPGGTAAELAAFNAMQSQTATFAATSGTTVTVSDPTVVQ